MAATVALVADSLSAFAPVRVWECLRCRKRWAVDNAIGCPYCVRQPITDKNPPKKNS